MRLISKELFKKPNNRLEGDQEHPAAPAAPEAEVRMAECPECKAQTVAAQLPGMDYLCPRCGAQYPVSARDRVLWRRELP